MAVPTAEDIARNAEKTRDLKQEVEGLATEALPGVIFIEISEGRTPVTIYSTEDGRPVTIPENMVPAVMEKRREDGQYRFVADPAKAPEYKLGTVKCFLHPDAPERATIVEAGLANKSCRKDTLGSDHSKILHAEHRHKQEWVAYQRFVGGRKEEA